jgi:hypothetical protein
MSYKPSTTPSPPWDLDESNWAHFKRKFKTWCVKHQIGYVLFAEETGTTAPTEDTHPKTHEMITANNKATVYAALEDSIEEHHYNELVPDAAAERELGGDPAKFWAMFVARAKGKFADTAGLDNFTEFTSQLWVTTTAAGQSLDQYEQSTATHAALQGLAAKAALIAADGLLITPAMVKGKFHQIIPPAMKLGNESDLLSAETAAAAVVKLHRIIKSRGSASLDPSIVLANIVGKPPFGTDMTGNRKHGGGAKPGHHTDQAPDKYHSKEAGPPNGDTTFKWCPVHHWCKHEFNVCRENPAVKTLLSIHPEVYVKNASGDYVALMATLPRITEIQKSMTVALKAGISLDRYVFMDSGAERGICNDINMCEAGTIRYFDTPLKMVGVGECEYIAEAFRITPIDLGNGIYILVRDQVLLSPDCPFNVASTDDWASIGLSTKVDGTASNNQLSVWLPGTQHEALCTKIGKLWAIPVNHSVPASRFVLGKANVEIYAISSANVPRRIWDGVTRPIPKQPVMLAAVLGYAHSKQVPYDMVTIDDVRTGTCSLTGWAEYWQQQHGPDPIDVPTNTNNNVPAAIQVKALPATNVQFNVAPADTADEEWTLVDHSGNAKANARRNRARGNQRRKTKPAGGDVGDTLPATAAPLTAPPAPVSGFTLVCRDTILQHDTATRHCNKILQHDTGYTRCLAIVADQGMALFYHHHVHTMYEQASYVNPK